MRSFFTLPDRWNPNLEAMILDQVHKIDFHISNHEIIEEVAAHFKNGSMVLFFTSDFLKKVYDELIGPARAFGYYYGDLPKAERSEMICTSSACQYGGDDQKFSAACVEILCAIDEERARRERPNSRVLPA